MTKGINWKKVGHLTAIFTLLAICTTGTALAAGRLDNVANAFVSAVKIAVVGVFGWKTCEMVLKERYSMAWGIGLCGAIIGGFLFLGEQTYTWAWNFLKGLIDGV